MQRLFLPFVLINLFFGMIACQSLPKKESTDPKPPLHRQLSTVEWVFEDPSMWSIEGDQVTLLETQESLHPFRRPYQLGYIRTKTFVQDFRMVARVKCTETELVQGRDIVLVYGYQSPSRFYYVHLSNHYAQEYHNGIFLVNKGDRIRVDHEGLLGATTTLIDDHNWHLITLTRQNGKASIIVDDQMIMTSEDNTILRGYVGFGSFDDTGSMQLLSLEQLSYN